MAKQSAKPGGPEQCHTTPTAGEKTSRAQQLRAKQERELLAAAIAKANRGEKLSAKELAAVERYEREQQQAAGLAFVRAVPKKLYEQWSGRQTKILHDQADLYGMPLRGATIDLAALVAWLHGFLAEHKHELAIVAKGEAAAGGERGKLLQEQVAMLRKKNLLLEAKLEEQAGELMPRDTIHMLLGRLAKILRKAGHQLHKIDPRAGAVLEGSLDRFQELLDQFADGRLADVDDSDQPVAA